jgi:very-short-patch-repair endonuclease
MMESQKKRPKNIIIGQKISRQKAALAHEFRRNMTETENILWQRLRANRLDGWHFRRQQVIAGLIVDFYCHQTGLAVELDGEIHAQQVDYDLERDRILADLGIRVLRIQNRAVEENLDGVLQGILAACNSEENLK